MIIIIRTNNYYVKEWIAVEEPCGFNPFASRDFTEKHILKLVEWFSGHCMAIKS